MSDETSLPPSPESESSTGLAPNIGAGLSCIFAPISSIIFLALEKKSEFIRYWAAQSTVFGGVFVVGGIALQIVMTILSAIHLGFLSIILGLLWLLICLGGLVVWIVMLIKSFGGQKWDIP